MIAFLRAIAYAVFHQNKVIYLAVVRRYVDAQKNFIGELYENGKMIGASCDNFPFNADIKPLPGKPRLCWGQDFLASLPPYTIRIGSFDPKDNDAVRKRMSDRRFCTFRIEFRNAFVEHVLESDICR